MYWYASYNFSSTVWNENCECKITYIPMNDISLNDNFWLNVSVSES